MKATVVLAALVALAPLGAVAGETIKLPPSAVTIERHFVRTDRLHSIVTVTNTTGQQLRYVDIRCYALGDGDQRIGVGEYSLLESEHGPLRPGVIITQDVYVRLDGAESERAECEAVAAVK